MRRWLLAVIVMLSPVAWSASLMDLYQEVLAFDPRLQQADAERDIYGARERYSRGGLLPQVSFSAQGTRNKREPIEGQNQDADYYYGERYSLALRQSLYNKAQWESFRAARRHTEEYESRYEDMEAAVTVDLAERYTQVLAAEDNLSFVVSEREAAESQLRQIRARYERQMAMVTDLYEVEARVDRLLTEELQARNDVELAREGMAEMLGRPLDEDLAPLLERPPVDEALQPLDEWLQLGLSNNHGLAAARSAVAAATAGVREARGRRHPTLDLQLSAQRTDIGYENAPAPESEYYVASLNLNMPIFSGGQVSAQISESRAQLRMAEQQLAEHERRIRKEIREAYLTTRTATMRVGATRKAMASADKSYEARQRGLEYGTVTVVDVLDAAEQLYMARRDHRQAYYDLMVQSLRLHQTTGLLTPDNVAQLDRWLDTSSYPDNSWKPEEPPELEISEE